MPALAPLPSPARVAANRQNSRQSTGPRTEAGKARSRLNAYQHGLAGAGLALPTEDEAAITAQTAAIENELAPTTALGAFYVRRIAGAMVRADRAARHEAKALAHRVRHAAREFDRERLAFAEVAIERLNTDRRTARRDLLRMPEGVDALIETLLDLQSCLARVEPDWSVDLEALLRACCGWRDREINPERGFALSRALLGDRRLLTRADRLLEARPPDPSRPSDLVLALASVIDDQIATLRAHRATLDHATIALDRAEAADRALFDPTPAAQLARRYEAAACREVRQALSQFHLVEARGATEASPPTIETTAEPAPAPAPSPSPEPIKKSATIAANSPSGNNLNAVVASFGIGDPLAAPGLWAEPAFNPLVADADEGSVGIRREVFVPEYIPMIQVG